MTSFLKYKPGELKERAQQSTLLGDIVFDCEPCDLTDVQIITLKQHVYEQAIDMTEGMRLHYPEEILEHTIADLLVVKFRYAKEFVSVGPDKITVGVNTKIVDDAAVDRALMLMIQVDDITQQGRTEFGEDVLVNGS